MPSFLRRLATPALGVLMCWSPAQAAPLTNAERDALLQQLEASELANYELLRDQLLAREGALRWPASAR